MNITRHARTLLVALFGATVMIAPATAAAPGPVAEASKIEPAAKGARITSMMAGTSAAFPNIPAKPGDKPADYELTSTHFLKWTMGKSYGDPTTTVAPGRTQNFVWECWTEHVDEQSGSTTIRVPGYRTTGWLIGYFANRGGNKVPWVGTPVDLYDIGAQHRTAVLLLRVVGDPNKITLYKTVDRGWVVPAGFLKREAVLGKPNRYQHDVLETFYEILPAQPTKTTSGYSYADRYMLISSDPDTTIEVCYTQHLPGDHTAQQEDGGPPSNPPVQEN